VNVEDTKHISVNLTSADDKPSPDTEQKPADTTSAVSNALLSSGERVLLQTAQVKVCGAEGVRLQARVLMDSASHCTFMTEHMAKKLKLHSH